MGRKRKAAIEQPTLFDSFARSINEWAVKIAKAMREAASRAQREEDIRVAVERQLALIQQDLNIELKGEHEYTLLRGHVDSVYGAVFIEYKNPADPSAKLGPQLSSPGTAKVLRQLEKRFSDVSRLLSGAPGNLLGIGTDGLYFVFSRFAGGRIETDPPVEVSQWSCRRFLWALFNLGERGWGLTPEALSRDFGGNSDIAGEGVSAFAEAVRTHLKSPKVATFFRQWIILFGEVCGYDLERPGSKINVLADHYHAPGATPAEMLFALHTYYALFMKLLASHVVNSFWKVSGSALESIRNARSSEEVLDRLRDLEEGGIFRHLSVSNFLEGDLFSWYLDAWSDRLESTVREMAGQLLSYNPGSLRDNPAAARDLLKRLFHELFPRSVRHDLGEYYTPDWLADFTLDEAGYDGDPAKRVLDPACGSGTFLVLALARVRGWLEKNFERAPQPSDVARMAARNIIGFDLNPLAVLAARTNYLIQIIDLFDYYGELKIPVYLCDSVLTPAEYGESQEEMLTEAPVEVPTSAAIFLVPREVTREADRLATYCDLLAKYARADSGNSVEDFLQACRDRLIPVSPGVENQHRDLFGEVRQLDRDRKNGVWARFIKNAFAPVFLKNEKVDFVVGNPPWVNWESLPGSMDAEGRPTYRQRIAKVFERYGLFSLSGSEGRLGGGKKDLSMLFAYASVDHYLRPGGRLGFVITQTLFKSMGAADGFRSFVFNDMTGRRGRPPKVFLRVRRVNDLSSFQPFEGATNRTAVFTCQKSDRPTTYPVSYVRWSKNPKQRVSPNDPIERVLLSTKRESFQAIPVVHGELSSPWLTMPKGVMEGIHRVMGQSEYRAVAGVCTWLNSVYWVRVIRAVPSGLLIENLNDIGKIKVQNTKCAIEPDLLHPLLRGRDVRRWSVAPSAQIVLTQDPKTRKGIPEGEMRRNFPLTWSYLKGFEALLRDRSGYRKYFHAEDPFYSIYNVGPYTLGRYKVVWREQSGAFQAAVAGPTEDNRRVAPDHKLMLVDFDNHPTEAHYVCALLNSAPSIALVGAYVVSTSTSTHVLEHVRIPKYDKDHPLHHRLAVLSQEAHAAVAHGKADSLREIESEIDGAAGKLWGIPKRELAAIVQYVRLQAPRPLLEPKGQSGAD